MSGTALKHIGLGVIFVLSHVLLFQYLSIFGAIADPVLIYIIWLCSKYKRTQIILFAAFFGLLQDAFFDVWGLFMFSKVILVFTTYKYIARYTERRLLLWQILIVIFIIAFLHNFFFVAMDTVIQSYSLSNSIFILLFANSFYTAIIGGLLYIFKEY